MVSRTRQSGYIALVALLIIAAAGLVIGVTVSLRGIEEIQLSYGVNRAAEARTAALTCVEDGLQRLQNSFVDYSGSLSINSNSCIIDIVTSGSSATIHATGTADIYYQKIEAVVDTDRTISTWLEE